MTHTVTLLGATGSIGRNTLDVITQSGGHYALAAITAQENVDALIEIARTHRPACAVIGNAAHYAALKEGLAGTGVEAAAGENAVTEAAAMPSDIVMSAIMGAACLKPTLAALTRGAKVALANKECLVTAGALVRETAQRAGARIIPVDSEHSAVFQALDATHPEWVEKVTLTASGGPFRTLSAEQLRTVTPAQAVKHPNWAMGAKISVDSATLMNKGLELIEAMHLFALPPEKLDIVIHPESIVHALVAYRDGSVLAQMSLPDMRTPIAYALAWPERIALTVPRLNLRETGKLTFEAPDETRFPALMLAREAMLAGGNACAALNAANEVAVQAFLQGHIGFSDISAIALRVMDALRAEPAATQLDAILAIDARARAYAREWTQQSAA